MPFCSGASTSLMIGAIRLVDRRLRGLEARAGFQAREQIDPVRAPIVEHLAAGLAAASAIVIGTNTCGREPIVVPSKPSGADADDRERPGR